MGTFGKFTLGALAGAAALAGVAFLYSTFCDDEEDDAEGFAGLEREPEDGCLDVEAAQAPVADVMPAVAEIETA